MPFAVAHMLIPMILIDVFRDNILKIKRSKLPNKYILIAGLAGLFPDMDMPLSLFFPTLFIHRAITHTVWFPVLFLLLSLVFYFSKNHNWSKIFLMCFIGTSIHIILDGVTAGSILIFYPLNNKISLSVNLVGSTNPSVVYSILDAVLLFIWFARMSLKKKIQDIV